MPHVETGTAELHFRDLATYPPETEVSIRPAYRYNAGHAPGGAPLATALMDAANGVTFSGLADNHRYVLHAEVAGEHRYVQASVFEDRSNIITPEERAALAGTAGAPGESNPYATKQTTDGLDGRVGALEASGVLHRSTFTADIPGSGSFWAETLDLPGPVIVTVKAWRWGWDNAAAGSNVCGIQRFDGGVWIDQPTVAHLEMDTPTTVFWTPLHVHARVDVAPGTYQLRARFFGSGVIKAGVADPTVVEVLVAPPDLF